MYDPNEFFSAERQLTKKLTKEKRQLTNADRIRAMSDRELAEYLSRVQGDIFRGEMLLTPQWLDWLKEEAE